MWTMVFQKTVKSIQNHLHSFFREWELIKDESVKSVSAAAWSKSRQKFSHGAFKEINDNVIVSAFYEEDFYHKWNGHRLLAIDGSSLSLPDHPSIEDQFGKQYQSNQHGPYPKGISMSRVSVLYDLINEIGIDAKIAPYKSSEYELAHEHVDNFVSPKDLLILDRGYGSFALFAHIIKADADVLCRLSSSSFTEVKTLLKRDKAGVSKIVKLKAGKHCYQKLKDMGLPKQLRLRFVTVRLETGELEVLVTSLLDKNKYPTELFKELYFKRWKIETYYSRIKNRLDLENFSGKTCESVLQDFYATILVSNFESILSDVAKEAMENENPKRANKYQLNKCVTYHAIKDHALEIILSDMPEEEVLEKLLKLFFGSMNYKRPERKVVRLKPSRWKTIRFIKTKKKASY